MDISLTTSPIQGTRRNPLSHIRTKDISNNPSFRLKHPGFRTALTALTEPRNLWRRITNFPSPRLQVALHTHLLYYASGLRTIRTTPVLHSSHGLQFCCSRSHNAWWCLCLSSADSHILPLWYCYISDAALAPSMFSFEILSQTVIQSSLRIPRMPLHLLRHYRI